jgi:toxin ParE1/3/4
MPGIRWTESAAHDLTRICDYIQEHDGASAARRVALKIYERLESLTQFPYSGRAGRKPRTRELVIPGLPWLAIYRVREDTVEIIRVVHGAQKWP